MKDNSLKIILEMMSKIDPTYEDNVEANQDSSSNTAAVADNQVAPANDDSDADTEEDTPSIRIGNKVKPKTEKIKTSDDVKNFNIKFHKKANVISKIKPEEPSQQQDDERDDFWSMPYVDTMSNLQKVAESDGEIAKQLNSHISQFNVTSDKYGIFSSQDTDNVSAFVPGAGKTGNDAENKDNIALNIVSKAFRKYGMADRFFSKPADLASYISQNAGIEMPNLPKANAMLKLFKTIYKAYSSNDFLQMIPEEEMENLKNSIDNIFSGDFSSQKVEGLSNAQASFFIKTFNGAVTVGLDSGKNHSVDIGNNEFIGLLKWLPKEDAKLRSVSYVKRELTSKNVSDKMKTIRQFIFSSGIEHRTLNINGFGPLLFNENLDDPVNDKTIEDLMSEATYVLSLAIDKNNEGLSGIERSNFSNRFQFAKKSYSSNDWCYSVMDYIINLAIILTYSKDSKSRDNNSTAVRIIFDDVLSKYFNLIETVNGFGGVNSETLLSIIPVSAFFEDNDGVSYMNNLIRKSDGRNRAILMSVLKEAMAKMSKSSIYKLELPSTEDGEIGLEQRGDNIEEKQRPSLYELFAEIVGQGKNVTQEKLTSAMRKYLQIQGISKNAVSCEWNNDNERNVDEELKQFIGKKSIDIALKDYNILIEYQGEQHYTPACCRGISPDIMGIGRGDLNYIHRTRGRASSYIKDSLKPGSEQTIIKLRDEQKLPNYGKFLTIDNFMERMASLVSEVVEYMKLMYGKTPDTVQKNDFLFYAWTYLGTFIENGIISDEELDLSQTEDLESNYNELQQMAKSARNDKGKWKEWGTVTSLVSRRRWYEELEVYLQQAADKQKFIAFKQKGWNFFYVCPAGNKINDELIIEQAQVPFVTDFTNFLNSNGKAKTIDDYVSSDSYDKEPEMVAEGIYKLAGNLKPEFMASNFSYRFANNENLESMGWINPNGLPENSFGNKENLAATVMSIINKKRGL